MAEPRGVGQSPFTKPQMEKITTLVKNSLTKTLEGRQFSVNKREIIETVKNQVIRALGSLTNSLNSVMVEKTVLNTIEEVWTDMQTLDKIPQFGKK